MVAGGRAVYRREGFSLFSYQYVLYICPPALSLASAYLILRPQTPDPRPQSDPGIQSGLFPVVNHNDKQPFKFRKEKWKDMNELDNGNIWKCEPKSNALTPQALLFWMSFKNSKPPCEEFIIQRFYIVA